MRKSGPLAQYPFVDLKAAFDILLVYGIDQGRHRSGYRIHNVIVRLGSGATSAKANRARQDIKVEIITGAYRNWPSTRGA